jgi:PAS domain S-box-containing protein
VLSEAATPMVLSALPADERDRRLALAVALASTIVVLAVLPFANRPLPQADTVLTALQVVLICNDFITAVLLLGQLKAVRLRALLLLACGYVYSGLMATAHLLTFPGAFAPHGLLGAGSQSTGYLFVFWHAGFVLFLLGYIMLRQRADAVSRIAIVLAMLATVALAAGLTAFGTAGSSVLPRMLDGNHYSSAFNAGRYGQWLLTAFALAVLWRRKPHSILDLWILMTLMVVWFEVALMGIFNSGRFDLGFYAGRVYGALASVFVLLVLLNEQSGLYAGLLRAHDRARAEITAQEEEARFRTMADTIPHLAWITDADGGNPWFNRRFYEYTGLAPGALTGLSLEQHLHDPRLRPQVEERWRRSLATGEPFEMVMPLRGADGRFRHFLTRASPLKNAKGEVVQWFGTNTDVSTQREAEEALRAADRRKDEFLATLAHELRNPLSPIRNSVALMGMLGPLPEQLDKIRQVIDRQTRHLTRLVDDLLEVSRITQGKVRLRRERIDLAAAARHAADAVGPAIRAAGHRLEVQVQPGELEAYADPTRIAQVLNNLLNNAVKFTPAGGRISLTAERLGDEALIHVRDTGVGLAQEHLETVFEMFSQPSPALERNESGLGIGLALVRGLVELHGGSVRAFSPGPGKGSEFVVRLPLLPRSYSSARPAAAEDRAPGQRKRVLVVDDNHDVASTLRQMLEIAGHEVREAGDGIEGVRVAADFKPQVVLLDIGMPRMNGYDAAKEIRRSAGAEAPRLIAMTGWGQADDKARAREAGFDVHLTKPVDPAALLELLGV